MQLPFSAEAHIRKALKNHKKSVVHQALCHPGLWNRVIDMKESFKDMLGHYIRLIEDGHIQERKEERKLIQIYKKRR